MEWQRGWSNEFDPTMGLIGLTWRHSCMIKFEWDPGKDRANQRKHGISFEEA